MRKMSQRHFDLTDGGLVYSRLAALGTMFFLGATVGRVLTVVPWWVPFIFAGLVGVYMIHAFLKASLRIAEHAEKDHHGGA
jgi:hypothetical protein